MSATIHIDLTKDGADLLLKCIDAAIRANGLDEAIALVPLALDIKSQQVKQ